VNTQYISLRLGSTTSCIEIFTYSETSGATKYKARDGFFSFDPEMTYVELEVEVQFEVSK